MAGQPAETEAPKFILDTNVYLDLADRQLLAVEKRLDAIAKHRAPPLLWACEHTFDELVCHITDEEASEFPRYRAALWWMERLCKGRGMAEPHKWAMRRGVFAGVVPDDGELALALVRARREILGAERYDQLSSEVRQTIEVMRADYRRRIDDWVAGRTTVQDALRAQIVLDPPDQPRPREAPAEYIDAAAKVLLEVSRNHAAKEIPKWGPLRTEDDQKCEQRELIAFEVALIRKAENPAGYDHARRRSDYNDYWMLAYPAAGYTLATSDKRLRNLIRFGGCPDGRLVSLDDAIEAVEAWIRRFPNAPVG